MNRKIFEVTREDYKSFINRLIKGAVKTETISLDENTQQINVFSVKTNKLLCGRECSRLEEIGEKYYIFEFPEKDEWTKPIPRAKIVLETPEEVQAVLEAFSKMREEQNAGVIH